MPHSRGCWKCRVVTAALAVLFVHPLSGTAQRSATGSGAAGAFPPDSVVLEILKERVAQGRTAGLVVGLFDGRGEPRVVSWGREDSPSLDGQSVFEIGSLTKVFTATLLADMVRKGEVSLDDSVQDYLPPGVTVPARSGERITLGLLAEQRSGLPRLPDNIRPADASNPYADYTVQQLYDFLSRYELTRDPGAAFEYSNLGVGLLGHALALHAGEPYEKLVRRRILEPLGMTHTGIALSPWMEEHLVAGHNERGDEVPLWDLPTLAGAGALRSTATDLLLFLAANLDPGRSPLGPAMALAQRERASTDTPNMAIGLNWMILHTGADTITWHNGGTGGYRTFLGMNASKGIGVIVLSNTGGSGADDIGLHLLRPELPLAQPSPPRREFTVVTLAPEVLATFVGTYRVTPQFELAVTLDGGQLFVQASNQGRLSLWPYSDHEFFIKDVEAQVTFETDATGAVTSLVLHQNGRDVSAERMR